METYDSLHSSLHFEVGRFMRLTMFRAILLCGIMGVGWATAACEAGPGKPDTVTIEYVAHACFRIHSPSGNSVMIDPYESQWWLGYDSPVGLDPADAVLITHPHSDHDGGLAAGRKLPWDKDTPIVTDHHGEVFSRLITAR